MFIVKENCRLCQKNEGIIPLEEDISKLIFKITLIEVSLIVVPLGVYNFIIFR